jgi:hypothetical protein
MPPAAKFRFLHAKNISAAEIRRQLRALDPKYNEQSKCKAMV